MANIFGGFIMARLTRTQKFAALREELANSSEQATATNELNKLQKQLDSLQNASEKEKVEKNEDYSIKVEPLPTFNEVKEEIKEEEKKVEKDFFDDFNLESINDAIDKIINQNVAILDNQEDDNAKFDLGFHDVDDEIEAEPVVEEIKPVEVENTNSLIDQTINELTEVINNTNDEGEPEVEIELVTEEEPIVVPERIEEPYNYIEQDYADIAELLKKEILELNGPVEPVMEDEPVVEELAEVPELVIPEITQEVELVDVELPEVDDVLVEEPEVELPNLDDLFILDIDDEEVTSPEEDESKFKLDKEEENVENKDPVAETEADVEADLSKEEPVVQEEVIDTENVTLEKDELETKLEEEESKPEDTVDVESVSDADVNSLLDSTLQEVENYNTQAGRMTVDQISNDLIEEVRHSNLTEDKEDDDFSNTVTLEIDKVLSEINLEPVVAPISVDKVLEKTVEIEPIDVKRNEAAEKLADTLTHPVLAKTLESAPVDIKSLDETFTKDMNTATLSFKKNEVVDEEDDEDYYYDDDKPNKVLNIVLIVLLIVFLIIVGVIVYFLLLAKGIL